MNRSTRPPAARSDAGDGVALRARAKAAITALVRARGWVASRRVALGVAVAVVAALAIGFAQRDTLTAGAARALAPTWRVPAIDTAGMTPSVVDAIEQAREAVVEAPRSHAAWFDLAAVLHAHSLHAEALAAYERAGSLRPDDPRTYYLRAILLPGEGGDVDLVLDLYERTAERDPQYPPLWLRRGQLLADSGRQAEAIHALRRAVELDPAFPMAHRELGLLLLESGDVSGALLHLKFAANLEPEDYPTWAGLSRAYTQAGLADSALHAAERSKPLTEVASYRDSVLDQVLDRGAGPVRLERLADAYLGVGAWSAAVEILKRVERDLPSSSEIQAKLAHAYEALGETELAAEHRRRADELAPPPADGSTGEP